MLIALLVLFPAPVASGASLCATPGRDGSVSLAGVVNAYFPGTASAAAGTASITLGASRGAATPIAAGDLLLVIQMQEAAINSTNSSSYGDGTGRETGSTSLNNAGRYEYVAALNAVPAGPGLTDGGLLFPKRGFSLRSARASRVERSSGTDAEDLGIVKKGCATRAAGTLESFDTAAF